MTWSKAGSRLLDVYREAIEAYDRHAIMPRSAAF